MSDHAPDRITPAGDISRLAEHLFRHEAGKLVSVLTGIFGIERLQLAEDVVQEALVRALKTWPYYGIPANPAAWLTQTAKNIAVDFLRREQNFVEKQSKIISTIEDWGTGGDSEEHGAFEGELKDHRLRLMFACCHPSIPVEAQIALALKTLAGFSPGEIAKAFLTTEAAILKRLTRARQRIAEMRIPFEIPAGEELPARLESVLQTLYLTFNEGYKASTGDKIVRAELCREAIQLAQLLANHPVGDQPRVHALVALMLLNGARLPSRSDGNGKVLRLEEQDRSLWDRAMIMRGMMHLARSAAGSEITPFHLQAGIAAVHSTARKYEETDWHRILHIYDQLVAIDDSPVVALNRAVAVGRVQGPQAGLAAVEKLRKEQMLESYHLLYAVMAEFESQVEDFEAAAANLRKAMKMTEVTSERELLERRLDSLGRRG